ncbi:MAG TPA: Npt1/Npt2 family nucleotide transporter, partial [Candidatus Rifleibacterium sp.]|nr:Npt1/Npt2 family nucleotide transporter [Candidatus Rifleibacterium sp.]
PTPGSDPANLPSPTAGIAVEAQVETTTAMIEAPTNHSTGEKPRSAVPLIAERDDINQARTSESSEAKTATAKRRELTLFKILAIGTYYLWVNMFSLMAVSMFWSFMNDVFSLEQSRKLYAIIGYGGLLGGLAGSALTSLLVKYTGTPNLFILAIVLLYPSIWCMQYIHHNHYRPEG